MYNSPKQIYIYIFVLNIKQFTIIYNKCVFKSLLIWDFNLLGSKRKKKFIYNIWVRENYIYFIYIYKNNNSELIILYSNYY